MWKCFGCQSTRLGRPRATKEAKRGPKNDYFRLLAVLGPEKASGVDIIKTEKVAEVPRRTLEVLFGLQKSSHCKFMLGFQNKAQALLTLS